MVDVHNLPNGDKLYFCDGCEKDFGTKEEALEHEKTCSKGIALAKEEEKKATKKREIPEKREKDPLKRKLQEMNRKRDEKTLSSLKKLRERENKIVEARENSKENYKGSKANLIEMHITLLLSILGGMIGADRAYKGQFGLAFLKFITLGGLGLWVIIDIWINALEARESWHQYYICLDEDKPDEEA